MLICVQDCCQDAIRSTSTTMLSSLPFNLVSDSCLSLCLLLELLLPEEAENRKKETGGQGVSHFWRQTLTAVHHIKPSESSCESCGTTCHQPRTQFMSICSCTAVSVTRGNTDVSWRHISADKTLPLVLSKLKQGFDPQSDNHSTITTRMVKPMV